MRLRRMKSHPAFRLEGRSRHFQSFWELELTPGEATTEHRHYESEEIICMVSGEGLVRVAEQERTIIPGEVVLVPPRTCHVIANDSRELVRAITVESRFDLGDAADAPLQAEASAGEADEARGAAAREQAARTARTIDELLAELPQAVDEAAAIKTIVELFNLGGDLTEQIEQSVGLESTEARAAVGEVERRIMLAVIEISARYRRPGPRWHIE